MNINCQQYITNSNVNSGNNGVGINLNNGLELVINGVKINIKV